MVDRAFFYQQQKIKTQKFVTLYCAIERRKTQGHLLATLDDTYSFSTLAKERRMQGSFVPNDNKNPNFLKYGIQSGLYMSRFN